VIQISDIHGYCLGGADAFYSYQSLPSKLWKKYLYAARFVNLVRAKTPKITLYTSKVCNYKEKERSIFVALSQVVLISGGVLGVGICTRSVLIHRIYLFYKFVTILVKI
jgi:hypothetical protein